MKIMSETAQTEQEFYRQAKNALQEIGVRNPTIGEPGSIPVRNSRSFEIEDISLTNSTRTGQQILNQFPRSPSERVLSSSFDRPVCHIFGCNLTKSLGIECTRTDTSYTDPDIEVVNTPSAISSATAYMNPLNARIEGSVDVKAQNESEPGKKKTRKSFKCKDGTEVTEEVVEGSAVTSMLSEHRIFDEEVNGLIDTVTSSIDDVAPDVSTESEATFEKSGALETIQGIVDIWTKGFTRASVTGTVDVKYEWRNTVKTERFDVDATVRLPVQNLNYGW